MSQHKKKPTPDFVMRMVGSNIRPWEVPLRKLTSALDAIQRLIEQKDKYDENSTTGTEAPLHLLDVVSGSAVFKVSASLPELSLGILGNTGRQIESPDSVEWTSASLSSIKELSHVAHALGCTIELRESGEGRELGSVLARIDPETYSLISASAFAIGETSIYGKIERVGGKTDMRCGLTIPSQNRMIICKVDGDDLTRQLGQYMYQYLVVSGTATWVRKGSFLTSLTIRSLDLPKSGSIQDALEAIHRAGGSAWDDVKDPDREIKRMRA